MIKVHELVNIQQNAALEINKFLTDNSIGKEKLVDMKYVVTDTPSRMVNVIIIYDDQFSHAPFLIQVQEFTNAGTSIGIQINKFLTDNQISLTKFIEVKYVVTDTETRSVNALLVYENSKKEE